MKDILILEGRCGDRVSCPDFVADNIKRYEQEFDKWLKTSDGHYVKSPGGHMAYSFNRDDVFDWFNDVLLADSDEKVVYVKEDYTPSRAELRKLPVLYV